MNDQQLRKRFDGLAADVRRARTDTQRLEVLLKTFMAGRVDCERRCRANAETLHGNGGWGLKARVYLLTWVLGVAVAGLLTLAAAWWKRE